MQIKTLVFKAGSRDDPKPADNELSKRFGHCLACNRIVHFSRTLKRWVYDDGTFHTGHQIEFPVEWLPAGFLIHAVQEVYV